MGDLVVPDWLESYQGKRVFITGHTGFKGSWLSFWLTKLGAEVCGYALPAERPDALFHRLQLSRSIRHIEADIRDFDRLKAALDEFQPAMVFHLAAQALVRRSYLEPKLTVDTNVGGSLNLLDCVRSSAGIRALVFVTSDKCYLNKEWIWGYRENDELGGHDPYSASKAAAELLFESYSRSFFQQQPLLGAASARAGNVIGGGDWSTDRVVPDAIRSLSTESPIRLRNPSATRPWQHVLEPLSGYLKLGARLAADPMRFAGSWNFGPRTTAVRTVMDLCQGLVSEWGGGSVQSVADANAPHEAQLLTLNCDKAAQLLDWIPRWDFNSTVRETAQWYKRVLSGESAETVTEEQIGSYVGALND